MRPVELRDDRTCAAYAYVLGQYLGDGYVATHRRSVYRLRIACADSWPLVVQRLTEELTTLFPHNAVGRVQKIGCADINVYSKRWPALLPQVGPGRKHERTLRLEAWQRELVYGDHTGPFICGLLHSDGCRVVNRIRHGERVYEYGRYAFSNRSDDIHRMLQRALRSVGIVSRRTGWQQTVGRRDGVAQLDALGARKDSPWPE